MPRTKVPPGRRSKRSCSSASICRGANLSCWATSEIDSARASRAAFNPAPMDSLITGSVIVPPLQRLIFARAREAPAQLVGIALLADALAQPAFYAQGEPQRFGAWRHQLVITRNELARVADITLPIADLAELQQGGRLVGVELERALEEFLGVLDVVGAHAAHAGGRVGAPGSLVEGIAQRLQEVADRLLLPRVLAQEPAEVVVDLRIVRRESQRALEARLGL